MIAMILLALLVGCFTLPIRDEPKQVKETEKPNPLGTFWQKFWENHKELLDVIDDSKTVTQGYRSYISSWFYTAEGTLVMYASEHKGQYHPKPRKIIIFNPDGGVASKKCYAETGVGQTYCEDGL